jgi:hypothetical protein
VITPYLRFTFKYTSAGDDKGDMDLTFRRRSDKMPEPPKARPAPHCRSNVSILCSSLIVTLRQQKMVHAVRIQDAPLKQTHMSSSAASD